ncbi:MAG: methyl-accepting chemotaxis protein [Acidobacteriota bacterium]|nr:methyl-accepting chemotaxis protein [Acidobacteriota bacterium]
MSETSRFAAYDLQGLARRSSRMESIMRFTVGKKLAGGFGVVFVLLFLTAGISYRKLEQLGEAQEVLTQKSLPMLLTCWNMRSANNRILADTFGYLLSSGDPAQAEPFHKDLQGIIQRSLRSLEVLKQNSAEMDDASRQNLDSLERDINALVATLKGFDTAHAANMNVEQAVYESLPRMLPLSVRIRKSSASIGDAMQRSMEASRDRMVAARRQAEWMLWSSAISACLIGSIFAAVLGRAISHSVQMVALRAQHIARGDLRGQPLPVSSQDELGDLAECVNSMQSALREVIQAMGEHAQSVVAASQETAAASVEVANGATAQRDQTQQVATAMHEMNATVVEVSHHSSGAANTAQEAAAAAGNGGKILEEALASIRIISSNVSSSAQQVEELGKQSDRIGQVIAVIDDIADQTNLLALNAAIEAARAGEQGRGFAVVADEVRKLAERTTTATKEIADMISGVQQQTRSAVDDMRLGTKQLGDGVDSTSRAANSIDEIIGAARRVGDMISQIATAATQQAVTVEQINRNVERINAIAGGAADSAGKAAHASGNLEDLATQMQKLLEHFQWEQQVPAQWNAPPAKLDARDDHRVLRLQ